MLVAASETAGSGGTVAVAFPFRTLLSNLNLLWSILPVCNWNPGVTHSPHEHFTPAQFQFPTLASHLGQHNFPSVATPLKVSQFGGSLRKYDEHADPARVACASTKSVLVNKRVLHFLQESSRSAVAISAEKIRYIYI